MFFFLCARKQKQLQTQTHIHIVVNMLVSEMEIISRSVVVVMLNALLLWCTPLLAQSGFCRGDGHHPMSLSNMLTSPNVACSSLSMWFAALLSRFYMTKGIVSQTYAWGVFRFAYGSYIVASVGFVTFMVFPLQDGYFKSPQAHTVAIVTFALAITAHFVVLNYAMHKRALRPLPVAHYISCVYTGLGIMTIILCGLTSYVSVDKGTYTQITFFRPETGATVQSWFEDNAFLLMELAVLNVIAFNTVMVHAAYILTESHPKRSQSRNIIYK